MSRPPVAPTAPDPSAAAPDASAAPDRHHLSRRGFVRAAALAGAAGAAGVLGYTWRVEPHWVEFVTRGLPIVGLPRALAGRRLVQLSDLHVGPRVDDAYLVHTLQRVAALDPDLVVVTGDFLTHREWRGDEQYVQLARVLAHLPRGRLGTFGVLGNHDWGPGWQDAAVAARVTAEAERAGVQVLRNATAQVAGLDLVGVDDLWSGRADLRRAMQERSAGAALVLCHNPDGLDALPWGDHRGWVLAGHTHGGQCRSPFLPPPILPVRNPRYAAGAVDAGGGRTVYVSRGVGYTIRARFNVRPEVTVFTLVAA